MAKINPALFSATLLVLAFALPAAPAHAQSTRTFVSPAGSDSNSCVLAAPCRTFQVALAHTNSGGEIAVLGTAGYNGGATLTIDKSISIVNPGGFEAGIVVPSGGTGIVINAGPNDVVSLRGLTIEGAGAGNAGILFSSGGTLSIIGCVVRNLSSDGIIITPSTSSNFTISDTIVSNAFLNEGIRIWPTGSAVVAGTISKVQVNKTNTAIWVRGNDTTGASLRVMIVDSIVSNSFSVGVLSQSASGAAPTSVLLRNSVVSGSNFGVDAEGIGAVARIGHSAVTGNNTGLTAINGGILYSYGDNEIDGNANDNWAALSALSTH
jgi:hypothetical protein